MVPATVRNRVEKVDVSRRVSWKPVCVPAKRGALIRVAQLQSDAHNRRSLTQQQVAKV